METFIHTYPNTCSNCVCLKYLEILSPKCRSKNGTSTTGVSQLCSHPADPQSSSSIKIPCHWFLRNFRDATVASKHKGQEAQEPYFQNFDQVLHIWSQYACWLEENKARPWKLGTLNNISNSCRMSDSSLPTTGRYWKPLLDHSLGFSTRHLVRSSLHLGIVVNDNP